MITWDWRGGAARALVGFALGGSASGCGDSGRADDGSGTLPPMTEVVGTTGPATTGPTGGGETASVSDSDAGSASNSATQSTPSTVSETLTGPGTDPTVTGPGTLSVSDTDTGPGTLTVTVSDSDSDSASASDTDETSDATTDEPCSGGGMGEFDFAYLWVANTDQGSISKVNTMTLIEEARYFADPTQSGAASTSRTSVNIDGHFVVVSNRGTGWVTKIAASEADCVDLNGNGTIDTSPNKDTLLPWGTDECVLWSTQVTNNVFSIGAGPRATAWAPGDFNMQTCKYENQKVWIGWLVGPGQAVMGRLDGLTGTLEGTAPLPNWPISIDAPNAYAPYGAAVDAQGYIWTTAVFSGVAYRVDPVTFEVKSWQSPDADSHYGMTVDNKSRVWFANWQGHGGVSYFDSTTETWTVIPSSGSDIYRGIAVDSNDQVWVASDAGGTHGCGMMQVDGVNNTVVQFHTFAQCSTPLGMSIDVDGDVWLVDHDGWAWEIDPVTYEKTQIPIANQHYTYSDMTGGGLKNAITPQ